MGGEGGKKVRRRGRASGTQRRGQTEKGKYIESNKTKIQCFSNSIFLYLPRNKMSVSA